MSRRAAFLSLRSPFIACCAPGTARAGAPDPLALRAEGVVVQWPLERDVDGGVDFWYERLGDDGSWQYVAVEGGYAFPAIGIITFPGRTTDHRAAVVKELQPGRHRLVKQLGVPGGHVTPAVEFDVVP